MSERILFGEFASFASSLTRFLPRMSRYWCSDHEVCVIFLQAAGVHNRLQQYKAAACLLHLPFLWNRFLAHCVFVYISPVPSEKHNQHGLFTDCCTDPWEVHRLLSPLWAPVRPLVVHHSAWWPHSALRQCRDEPGKEVWTYLQKWANISVYVVGNNIFFYSTSLSSWTPSTHPTLWPDFIVLQIHRSAFVLAANTMTLMMWEKTCTIILSSRCWDLGPLEIILK